MFAITKKPFSKLYLHFIFINTIKFPIYAHRCSTHPFHKSWFSQSTPPLLFLIYFRITHLFTIVHFFVTIQKRGRSFTIHQTICSPKFHYVLVIFFKPLESDLKVSYVL